MNLQEMPNKMRYAELSYLFQMGHKLFSIMQKRQVYNPYRYHYCNIYDVGAPGERTKLPVSLEILRTFCHAHCSEAAYFDLCGGVGAVRERELEVASLLITCLAWDFQT